MLLLDLHLATGLALHGYDILPPPPDKISHNPVGHADLFLHELVIAGARTIVPPSPVADEAGNGLGNVGGLRSG